jgi:ribonuclease P protein component
MQKEYRIKSKNDYAKVYRHGKSVANFQFVLYWLAVKQATNFRLGISASKKIGNAVVRNRMRRVVKEIIRLNSECIKSPVDMVIIIRKPAVDMKYHELQKSIMHLYRKAGFVSSFQKKDKL